MKEKHETFTQGKTVIQAEKKDKTNKESEKKKSADPKKCVRLQQQNTNKTQTVSAIKNGKTCEVMEELGYLRDIPDQISK